MQLVNKKHLIVVMVRLLIVTFRWFDIQVKMEIIAICATFVAGILGLAYPVLLQVVARLEEKYLSNNLVVLFFMEREVARFKTVLILSLSFQGLYLILSLPPISVYLSEIGYGYITLLSLVYFILLFLILLVFAFFFLIAKILIYYNTKRLAKYLVEKYHREKSENKKSLFFENINDLMLFAIRNNNIETGQYLSDYYYKLFSVFRQNPDNRGKEYTQAYYRTIYNFGSELVRSNNKQFGFLAYRTIGGIWLLGESGSFPISKHTYNSIWGNLRMALENNREDLIEMYWQNAYQFFTYQLGVIMPSYVDEKNGHRTLEIMQREEERQSFLEFHYVLGGLLLYLNRYKLLRKLWNYTQSYPPEYKLLPSTMDEVFKLYIDVSDPYNRRFEWIHMSNPFPELNGMNAEWGIRSWVGKYAGLLFLRQYTLVPFLIVQKPMKEPAIPQKKHDRRLWIEKLDSFRDLVSILFGDEELLKGVGIDYITKMETDGFVHPVDYINVVKQKIVKEHERTFIEESISEEKRKEFNQGTIQELNDIHLLIGNINGSRLLDESDCEVVFFSHATNLVEKELFAEESNFPMDEHKFTFGRAYKKYIWDVINQSFSARITNSILLKNEDWKDGLRILLKGVEDIVVINFGFLKEHGEDYIHITKEHGVNVISFDKLYPSFTGRKLLILKKADMPFFAPGKIENEYIKEYALEDISDCKNIYASIMDLNDNQEMRNKLEPYNPNRDLRKDILINIFLNMEMRWRKNVKMVALQIYSEYTESSFPTQLSDIKPFDEL